MLQSQEVKVMRGQRGFISLSRRRSFNLAKIHTVIVMSILPYEVKFGQIF